jgi:hypothetical protein
MPPLHHETFACTDPLVLHGAKSSWAVELVHFAGQDFAVYCDSDDDGQIKLRPLIDKSAAVPIVVTTANAVARSWETPAACVIEDRLFIAWRDKHDSTLRVALTRSLETWTLHTIATRVKTNTRPALVSLDGSLHLLWAAQAYDRQPDALMHTFFPPFFARIPDGVPTGFDTQHSPSMTVFKGRLHAAWTGYHDDQPLFTATYAGGVWSSQTRLMDAVRSDRGPGIASTRDRLFLFFRQPGSGAMRTCYSTDGVRWTAPQCLPAGEARSDQDVIASNCRGGMTIGWNRDWQMHYVIASQGPLLYGVNDGAVLQQADDPTVYVVCGGARFGLSTAEEFLQLGYGPDDIVQLPGGALDQLDGLPSDGSIFRELGHDLVWKMVGGARLAVASPEELHTVNAGRRLVVLPRGATTGMPIVPRDGTAVLVLTQPGWGIPYIVRNGKLIMHEVGPNPQVAPASIFSVLPRDTNARAHMDPNPRSVPAPSDAPGRSQ